MDKKYSDFIAKQKTALISSTDADGYPYTKAMLAPRKIDGNVMYFTTNTSSLRVQHYRENDKASVYFFDKGLTVYTGLLLVGTMEVLTDQASKDMIWRTGDTMYYKKGVTDPDYCVLKFTAAKGRYYRNLTKENFDL